MIGFGVSLSSNLEIGGVYECSTLRLSGLRLVINIGIKLTDSGDERLLTGMVEDKKASGTVVVFED
jgi:hypothetical protein